MSKYFHPGQFSHLKSMDFDDAHIITSKEGVVSSREEIEFNNNRIIVAPMSAIQNSEFNKECVRLGLSLPVHRFCSTEDQYTLMHEAMDEAGTYSSQSKLWLSVGLKDWKERFDFCKKLLNLKEFNILLDVAFCDSKPVAAIIKDIKKHTSLQVFTGNVHTNASFKRVSEHSYMLRCGIGGGEACLTTPNTGIGRGQLTTVLDCNMRDLKNNSYLVADGGIRKPGDAAKAFGAGADYIMIGGMFKNAVESEAFQKGVFYGGASATGKKLSNSNDNRYIEGASLTVDKNSGAALATIVQEIADGVRSCISYCGYATLQEYIGNAVFEEKV